MNEIETMLAMQDFCRGRTLATLGEFEKLPNSLAALGWRPGPGRAHVGWQFMHIAITEELFATARLQGAEPSFTGLIDRFKGGSTPDEDIPTFDTIRQVLIETREHLRATIRSFGESDLDVVPEGLSQRGWTLRTALQVLAWHEAHHQGQSHITLNLYRAAHPIT